MSEEFNKWWLALPDERHKILVDDKWMLATASFRAGKQVATEAMQSKLDSQSEELADLRDFAIWLTGCGYDFTHHQYFLDNRHLLRGKLEVKE